MSVEEAVTDGLNAPMDNNAQAAEEAKKMLAEMEGEDAKLSEPQDSNGVKKEADVNHENADQELAAPKSEDKLGHDDTEDERREKRQDKRFDGRGRGRGGRDGGRGFGGGRGRGRGGGDGHRSFRDNVKTDFSSEEITDDPNLIRKQVHFYFSDSNLPNDKFLFGLTEGLANKPVELKQLHSFKRMRRFQPFEAIVTALKDSYHVELTDDDTCVRRKIPLPADYFDVPHTEQNKRSVYLKGFGPEDTRTQFDIEAFFDPYGPVRAVRLRRNDEKTFKGSVFVEFDTQELCDAFLALDPKPKYNDKELQIMPKTQYMDTKITELNKGEKVSNGKFPNGRGGRQERDRDHRPRRASPDYSRGGRGKHDDRDWRTRRDEDQKKGFRDDKRGDRDRNGRGNKGYGGGRSRGPETDERGVPTIKSTAKDKDSARDEALAKARAAVAADRKADEEEQEAAVKIESSEQNGDADVSSKTADTVAESIQADVKAVAGKKRGREADDGREDERDTKKVDTKEETAAES